MKKFPEAAKKKIGWQIEKMCIRDSSKRVKIEEGKTVILVTHDPVSYTHLDVYKRQAIANVLSSV